ncbi:MAG: hypothetical protein ACREMK_06785 [Gemmatimonadota bacterium]
MHGPRWVHVLALALAVVLVAAWQPVSNDDEITVRRINVVDEAGQVRLVISGDLPDPIARGQQVERSISPAGILWFDEDGNESGGLVTAPTGGGGKQRGIIFDFTHQPTDAVSVGTIESGDGEVWMAGLMVHDRLPYEPGEIGTSQGKRRILLGTQNQDAGLVILDPQERERIRIGVGPDGTAGIEILNEEGEIVYRAPE